MSDLEALFLELIKNQQDRVLRCAQRVVPQVTEEDLLQPNDFPELEEHPAFRYEEGVLEGLRTARAAFRAHLSDCRFAVPASLEHADGAPLLSNLDHHPPCGRS